MSAAANVARHPRHVALAALVAGLVAAGQAEAALVGGLCAAAVTVTWLRPAAPALVIVLVVLPPAGALVGSARLDAIDRSEIARHAGAAVAVRGHVVRRERESFGTWRARVRAVALRVDGRWRETSGLVQVRSRARPPAPPAVGDEIAAGGDLAVPGEAAEASGYAAHLRRGGVRVLLYAERIRVTGRRRGGLAGVVDAVRRRAERGVGAGLDTTQAALARGMVLGADEDIPARMAEDFKRSGLAHLLAVSGQNVTLLALLAWPLLGALRVPRGPRLWAVAGLIVLYVPLTGAGPSIVRAGAMGIAGLLAALAGRPASRWYGLLIASLVTLVLDPHAWQDVGWQLSFAAVVGIFALSRPLAAALHRVPEPLRSGTALTVAATLATAPLMAFHFERASPAALPANLAALPAVAPLMWIGMLSAALAQVALAPAELLNAVNAFCLGHVAAVARWAAGLPGAALGVRIGSPLTLAAVYATGAAALWGAARGARRLGPRMRIAVAAALAAAALACAALAGTAGSAQPPRHFTATFLDVGQGDATLLQEPGGATVLVDGGPAGSGIVDKLRARGVRAVDLAVLTHAQEDHQGGLNEVIESFPVGTLLDGALPGDGPEHRRIVHRARARGARVLRARAGQRLQVGGGLRLRVLHAADGASVAEDPNLRAAVLIASYGSFDVFLPADAESDVTAGLPLAHVEALKVAHHGSADEGLPDLLGRLRPDAAVIEVGRRNRFGHPHPDTLKALRANVPVVLRTDRDGDVALSLERGRLRFDRGR